MNNLINNLINDIWQFGLGTRTSLLGPVIQNRDYAPQPGGHDSGQVIQSALLVPGGLGVVVWDSEFYLSLVDVPDGLEAAAGMYHIPFEQCCPAWRALLSEHIAPLLQKFFDMLLRTYSRRRWQDIRIWKDLTIRGTRVARDPPFRFLSLTTRRK